MSERPAIGASVDLGSNSVHLLVAAITGHRLRPLVDESVFLGLGALVDREAHLGPRQRLACLPGTCRCARTSINNLLSPSSCAKLSNN
jgi:hypothetical protein